MQREFFRKRQKGEQLQYAEATIQDSIFEKLEASSVGKKSFDFAQHKISLLQKRSHVSSNLNGHSQSRPAMQKPIAPQPPTRKNGKAEFPDLQGLRPSASEMDEHIQTAAHTTQHTPQKCNPSKSAMSSELSMQQVGQRKDQMIMVSSSSS